ncbi:MAG: type II secretion system F family protein [Oxalobacteraceae bacterium]|jgi:type IV pilus assembly protein PilC|nr:type II secretion system F family protein [Oxalobacteraceae bacterium]
MTPASPSQASNTNELIFVWEGKDKSGRIVQGEMRATGAERVNILLRRQGLTAISIKKKSTLRQQRIKEKDICIFTRQLATMLKSGVPLLQAFDIVARGHANPSVSRLLWDVRAHIETGSSLSQSLRRYPAYFDALFCNLVAAGEQAGILDDALARLATYKEKTLSVKGKIRAAMFYPAAVLAVAFIVTAAIMIWVVPAFKNVFESFGAELPLPTQFVIWLSDHFVSYWYLIFGGVSLGSFFLIRAWKRSPALQATADRWLLQLPLFGEIVRKAVIARWTRTLCTMFSAGVPLVESLDSVGGASGNAVYVDATRRITASVKSGTSLTMAMQSTHIFPSMVTQMVAIGEESGALDQMLRKVAEFYEDEVDTAVASLASLMEPIIMVILGCLIGGLVIAMYLPIFKLGSVV